MGTPRKNLMLEIIWVTAPTSFSGWDPRGTHHLCVYRWSVTFEQHRWKNSIESSTFANKSLTRTANRQHLRITLGRCTYVTTTIKSSLAIELSPWHAWIFTVETLPGTNREHSTQKKSPKALNLGAFPMGRPGPSLGTDSHMRRTQYTRVRCYPKANASERFPTLCAPLRRLIHCTPARNRQTRLANMPPSVLHTLDTGAARGEPETGTNKRRGDRLGMGYIGDRAHCFPILKTDAPVSLWVFFRVRKVALVVYHNSAKPCCRLHDWTGFEPPFFRILGQPILALIFPQWHDILSLLRFT